MNFRSSIWWTVEKAKNDDFFFFLETIFLCKFLGNILCRLFTLEKLIFKHVEIFFLFLQCRKSSNSNFPLVHDRRVKKKQFFSKCFSFCLVCWCWRLQSSVSNAQIDCPKKCYLLTFGSNLIINCMYTAF